MITLKDQANGEMQIVSGVFGVSLENGALHRPVASSRNYTEEYKHTRVVLAALDFRLVLDLRFDVTYFALCAC